MSNRTKIKGHSEKVVTKTEKHGRNVILYIFVALIVLALIFMGYTMVVMS
ncbi:MAG: hypothetical protein KBS65_05900 [Prevotella sp.]|nr:hypothetical protein [Candidatus Equicola stercoris]